MLRPFEQSEVLMEAIYEVWSGLETIILSIYEEYGLAERHAYILGKIARDPGIILSEIARKTGDPKSKVFRRVDYLYQQGLIEKRSDSSDNRIIRLFISETAIELIEKMRLEVKTHLDDILNDFSETQLTGIIKDMYNFKLAIKRYKEKDMEQE